MGGVLGRSKYEDAVSMKKRVIGLSTIIVFLLLEAYFLMDGVYALLGLDVPFSIFWLDVYSIQIKLALTCMIIPISIVLMLFILRYREVTFRFFAIILVILILTNVVGFLTLPIGIARFTKQQNYLNFQNRVYQVTQSYAAISLSDAHPYLDLYECDTLGFLCQRIFRYEWMFMKPTIEWSENHQWQSMLVSDATAHTVALQINGETVYVHSVK